MYCACNIALSKVGRIDPVFFYNEITQPSLTLECVRVPFKKSLNLCFAESLKKSKHFFFKKTYSQLPNKRVYSLNYFGLFYILLALIVNLLT